MTVTLTDREAAILAALEDGVGTSTAEVAEKAGLTQPKARRTLNELAAAGKVERVQGTRKVWWFPR